MAKTVYAWSPILAANDKAETRTIAVGAKVSPADVGGDDQFNELIDEGVLRSQKVPNTKGDESPMQAVRRQAREIVNAVESGKYDDPEVVEAMKVLQPPAPVSDRVPTEDENAGGEK